MGVSYERDTPVLQLDVPVSCYKYVHFGNRTVPRDDLWNGRFLAGKPPTNIIEN